MATTVDTLLVRIEADMSDLKQSLDKVQRDVDKANQGMSSRFRQLGGVIKGVLAGVAVQQLGRAGIAAVNFAGDIQEMQSKSAAVFGVFQGDVQQALSEFANQVGRSEFALEGMASTLQDTFVPMGFARGEAAKLSVEMTKLAVDVASFNNASDTDTIEAFQSALVGNHETVRRFGIVITEATLNQELLNMGIKGGTKAATEAQKVQARMNMIIKGTSDAHGDAAKTAESFNNQLKGAKADVQILAKEIGEELMPIALGLVGTFRELTQSITDAGIAMGIFAVEPKKKLQVITDEFEELEDARQILEDFAGVEFAGTERSDAAKVLNRFGSLEELKARMDEIRAERKILRAEIDAAEETANAAKAAQANASKGDIATPTLTPAQVKAKENLAEQRSNLEALIELNKSRHDAENRLEEAIRKKNKTEEINARISLAMMDLKKQFPDVAATELTAEARLIANREYANRVGAESIAISEKRRDELLSTADEMKNIADPLRQLKALEDEYNAALSAGLVTKAQHAAAIKQVRDQMEQIKQDMVELSPFYKDMQDKANAAFDSIADALTDMVTKGKFDLDTLGNIFKQTIREMIADAVKAQVIKPLLSSAFGFIGGAIGGPVGTFISGIGQKAGGGDIDRPTLVGERGPELFVPHSAGTILNNHNTKNALGGGGNTAVYQTINVSAGVSQTVRAEMLSLLPRFKQDTMAAVVDAKRRGGSFGQAFG